MTGILRRQLHFFSLLRFVCVSTNVCARGSRSASQPTASTTARGHGSPRPCKDVAPEPCRTVLSKSIRSFTAPIEHAGTEGSIPCRGLGQVRACVHAASVLTRSLVGRKGLTCAHERAYNIDRHAGCQQRSSGATQEATVTFLRRVKVVPVAHSTRRGCVPEGTSVATGGRLSRV